MVGKRSGLDDETVEMLGKEMEKGIGFGAELIIAMMAGAIFAIIGAILKIAGLNNIIIFCLIIIFVLFMIWIYKKIEKKQKDNHYKKITRQYKEIKKTYNSSFEEKWAICPKCGYKNSKFIIKCENCGTMMEDRKDLNYYCENCCTDIPKAKYCPRCGSIHITRKK